ncbi:MAG: hypothetical protein JRJ29_00470 [Deltaproteobacteria bacterium]|nr:hypothetical protein [Deltaproteobacteria bacterium]MBW2081642.1 hypothetical protein [Deltaproteobacteria bacterium]
MLKRLTAVVMIAALVFSLVACAGVQKRAEEPKAWGDVINATPYLMNFVIVKHGDGIVAKGSLLPGESQRVGLTVGFYAFVYQIIEDGRVIFQSLNYFSVPEETVAKNKYWRITIRPHQVDA